MEPETAAALAELAEEPGLWIPPQPGYARVDADGYTLTTLGRSAWVNRVRLAPASVAAAVDEVRALLRGRDFRDVIWWVGELSTPPGLAGELLALGLEPGEPAELTSLGIVTRPRGSASAEVERVESLEHYLEALELEWEGFGLAHDERERRRREAPEAWPALVADGSSATYLARLDGVGAGFARAVFTAQGALLLGGTTLPWARGRGVYTSTVLTRFDDSASRGVPRLAVAAGPASAPVLERLGFSPLGRVLLLRDRL